MHSVRPKVSAAPQAPPSVALEALSSWGVLPDILPVGVYSCDDRGLLVQYNRRAAEMWGRSPPTGDPVVRFCGALKAWRPDGSALESRDGPVAEVLRTGRSVRDREVVIERPDGERLTILASSDPLIDPQGKVVGAITCLQDASPLKRQQEATLSSETRSRDILEALPAAVYTTDSAGRITFYNQAAADMAGTQPRLGVDEWCVTWRLFNTDGTPLPHDECPMAIALQSGEPVRGAEAVAERPDGTRVPFVPYPTPLRDDQGRVVGAVNMLVDISDQKQAEAQQKLLVDELNHRVKNTLATVQSIAMQTARGAKSLAEFLSVFEGRLMGLGKTHDLLTRYKWTGARLEEILGQELKTFTAAGQNVIKIDGPDINLKPRPAMAFAMALHELTANAASHGSLSRPDGNVAVTWKVKRHKVVGDVLALEWVEAGGPPVTAPQARGFGHRLIERTFTLDLGGTCELVFARSGLRCEISVPLDGVAI